MKMDFGLYQQQTTSLYMTQQLRQAISLLQLSTLDLVTFVKEQAIENPLIELNDEMPQESGTTVIDREEISQDARPYEGDIQPSPFDFICNGRIGLTEHLINQIRLLPLKKKEIPFVEYIALSVSDDGYIHRTVEELAEELHLSVEETEKCLGIIQSLEPVGVGSRNLQECLLIQLRHREERNFLTEIIVEDYLDLLAEKRWKEISKSLSVTMHEIQEVYDEIQQLEPRPGSNFGNEPTKFIIPDVSIELVEGELIVIVNDDYLPTISMSREYRHMLKGKGKTEEVQFVKDKYEHMQWLVKSIQQRQQTLYRVTQAIVKHQREFFFHGAESLKPMTLKQIAEELDIHESTVSRTTTNKYAQTPRGLLELKYFFSSSLANEEKSTVFIKELIKDMVRDEDKRKPLSDQKIVKKLLEEQNIHISRRAIAKYREELNIPSSSKRKRFE
ncbi:RNA polymerase factor sigma-54 [Bacillus sp. FJAT-45350]|uniref:RNA polymerase factor sigma-54 n=1 Tax=Bacillus sp. FJAT-45350 TaxID=2011014 RepID=UPI00211BF7FD|nr:RNA polymerase factor sigma-54 [Bacillus sp. FJAT-45350]